MKKHHLQVLLEVLDLGVGSELGPYSGRGMCGRKCLGVTTDLGVGKFAACVMEGLTDEGISRALDVEELDVKSVIDGFRRFQEDRMGRGNVYYFPGVPYVSDEEEEGEEDDTNEGT